MPYLQTGRDKLKYLAAAVVVLAAVTGAALLFLNRAPEEYRREEYALGTIVRLSVWSKDEGQADAALANTAAAIARYESLFSANIASSDVSRANSAVGRDARVSAETAELMSKAIEIANMTGGAFDPAIGAVVKLWGIGTDRARVPADTEIAAALKEVNYKKIKTEHRGEKYLLSSGNGQKIDLGGIAKGYIADRLAELLRSEGIKSAIVDLGGNLEVVGSQPKGRPWRLGIQDPLKPRGEYFAVADVTDSSVVTSGPYERYFEKDGVRYHHIFDPSTGRPATSDLSSVTIIDRDSAMADALCTALFVMGRRRAEEFLRAHRELHSVLLTDDGKVYITGNLKEVLSLKDASKKMITIEGTER